MTGSKSLLKFTIVFDFIHFWSVILVNNIKTTSFTPPSVIKLHLLFAHAFTCFGLLVNYCTIVFIYFYKVLNKTITLYRSKISLLRLVFTNLILCY
jgi:hypothetical protein